MSRPRRIYLVRHGESEGNVNKEIYKTKPDYALELTFDGIMQARRAGEAINKEILPHETIAFYSSPFYRTRQTKTEMQRYLKCFKIEDDGNIKTLRHYTFCEDPRLREQEWTTRLRVDRCELDKIETERDCLGHFYYRFEHGESCADVYDRLSTFLDTLHRDFEKDDFPDNVIIVGHGMTNRVFLMRWFHMTVEEFERLRNPRNGGFYRLERPRGERKFVLTTEPERYDEPTRMF